MTYCKRCNEEEVSKGFDLCRQCEEYVKDRTREIEEMSDRDLLVLIYEMLDDEQDLNRIE